MLGVAKVGEETKAVLYTVTFILNVNRLNNRFQMQTELDNLMTLK